MKKFLAVLLSLLLAFSLCVPAFAQDDEGGDESGGGIGDMLGGLLENIPGLDGIIGTVTDMIGGLDPEMIKDAIGGVVEQVSSVLPSPEDMTPEAIQQAIGDYLSTDENGNPYTDAEGNVSVNPDKIDSLFEILEVLDYKEIQAALDTMKEAGLLSEDDYDVLKGVTEDRSEAESIADQSRLDAGLEPPPSPTAGVKAFFENAFGFVSDLFSGLFGGLGDLFGGGLGDLFGGLGGLGDLLGGLGGIGDLLGGLFGGGGGSEPAPVTPPPAASDSGDRLADEDFSNNKTGDLALYSVAGVALAAGAVLVLTRKKKK